MPGPYSVTFDYNVPILLRDGVTTYADVFRPQVDGSVPALLQRTPYDKSAPSNRTGTLDATRAASYGYAVVIQDVRGRYSSEGEFYTFFNEISDGYDSVEWVASQPWCNGKVGMFGVSYVGATQWLAAKSGAPSLAGIAPGVTAHVTPGHTPAHMSLRIASRGQHAAFICDLASLAIHFERLAWMSAYDVEPLVTLETKRNWQPWALETGALLFFPHDIRIPAGRLTKGEDGRMRVVAACPKDRIISTADSL